MTIIPWPTVGKPSRAKLPGKLVVDPLPPSVLHSLVDDLPGPKNETQAQRAVRFDAQMAEVLSYNPRDAADAVIATNCVLMRLVADDFRRDRRGIGTPTGIMKKFLRGNKHIDKLVRDLEKALRLRQTISRGEMDPAVFRSLGLSEFLIPDPDDPAQPGHAVSAVIVPLHPAPKSLQ